MPDILPDHQWWLLVAAVIAFAVPGFLAVYHGSAIVARPVGAPARARYVSEIEYWNEKLGINRVDDLFGSRLVFTLLAVLIAPVPLLYHLDGDEWPWPGAAGFVAGIALLLLLTLIWAAMAAAIDQPEGSFSSAREAERTERRARRSLLWWLLLPAVVAAGAVGVTGLWV